MRRRRLSAPAARRPAAPPPDDALIPRLRAGDEAAFETLYLAYHESLWRFVYGYVRAADAAEELVQEVFLALWRGRAEWEVATSVRAWLYAAARNQALNHLRHQRLVTRLRDRLADGGAEEFGRPLAMGAPPPDAHATAEAAELDAAVARALAALPERRRQAMTLRWRHQLAPAEIARVLGTTPEAVRVLLTRARQELAALLGPR